MPEPIPMPAFQSDAYCTAAETGRLQRQLGEVFIDQTGVDGAKASLARALAPDPHPPLP